MEFTGRFVRAGMDMEQGIPVITFSVNEPYVMTQLDKIKDASRLQIISKPFRKKRSLDANAYMWVLLQQMAMALHTDKEAVYLQMLEKYGVFTTLVVDPGKAERIVETLRVCKNFGEITVKGKKGIQIQYYYGSSTYDSEEMAHLINGIVHECNELKIQTISPDEIDRLKEEWGR